MLDLQQVDKETLKGGQYRKSMPFYEISLKPNVLTSQYSIF